MPSAGQLSASQVLFAISLVAALATAHALQRYSFTLWMWATVLLAIAMVRTRIDSSEALAARLLQLVGSLSAAYSLLHYPLMPALPGLRAGSAYALLLSTWVASIGCGVGCWRRPSLAVVPPAYLVWSAHFAARVTGLAHSASLDVAPLPEVSLCIVEGLVLARLAAHWSKRRSGAELDTADRIAFGQITLSFATGLHLANYFFSGLAKARLDGPFLSWVTDNNPLYIFLAAMDDGHVIFSSYPGPTALVARLLDQTHFVSNIAVFATQLAALIGLLLPKRGLIWLLLAFDAMHVSIAVVAGANFWPWVLLNVAIVLVVASPAYAQPRAALAAIATVFIVIAPRVGNVAPLGWFDTGANNKVAFLAVDASGRRYDVPPNFFGFYSYPIAHVQYGMPAPEAAFATGTPNGGAWDIDLARAGWQCDVERLVRPGANAAPDPQLVPFIRNYHRLARQLEHEFGAHPFNLYPHHFYVRPSAMDGFNQVDKDKIIAYVMRRESVCLTLLNGLPHRQVISSAEMRIDLLPR